MNDCTFKVLIIISCILIIITGLILAFLREKRNILHKITDLQDGSGNLKDGSFSFKFAIGLVLIVVGLGSSIYSVKYLPNCEDESQDVFLDQDEIFVFSYLLTDPQATARGVWVYPSHQQLTYRGYKASQVTAIMTSLQNKEFIEIINVKKINEFSNKEEESPAYKITKKGCLFIDKNRTKFPEIRDTYYYTIKVYGTRTSNQLFLENIRDLRFVQKQTRFINEQDTLLSAIAVFAYKPLDEKLIFQIARITKAKIYKFYEQD